MLHFFGHKCTTNKLFNTISQPISLNLFSCIFTVNWFLNRTILISIRIILELKSPMYYFHYTTDTRHTDQLLLLKHKKTTKKDTMLQDITLFLLEASNQIHCGAIGST